jgi:hypothetical protein
LRCQAQVLKAIFGAVAIVGIAINNKHMVNIGQRLASSNDQAIEGAVAIAVVKVRMVKALRSRAGHPALFQHGLIGVEGCKWMNDTYVGIAKKICVTSLIGGLSYISKLVYSKF